MLNLAATHFKKAVYYIQEISLHNFVVQSWMCVLYMMSYYTQRIMVVLLSTLRNGVKSNGCIFAYVLLIIQHNLYSHEDESRCWALVSRHGNWEVILTLESIQKKMTKLIKGVKSCSENWGENHLSPQCKRQRICSRCKIYFLTGKNMASLSELILQIVTYFHAGSHTKPQRVKMRMQIRTDRKEHKNNERGHSVTFCICIGYKLIRGEVAVSLKRRRRGQLWIWKEVFLVRHRSFFCR